MLLLTGATGSIGSRLLPLLLESGEEVRCLVREPRRLGERRVDVQIALGDLGELSDPYLLRQALRGVDTVVHLAATIRDQPPKRIEELNGLATVRLLRAAERGRGRALPLLQRARRLRGAAHALLPRQVAGRAGGRLLAAGDDGLRALDRLRPQRPLDHAAAPLLLPAGAAGLRRRAGRVPADLGRGRRPLRGRRAGAGEGAAARYELAGPETLTYDQMSDLVSRIAGRPRPLVHLPLPAGALELDRDPLPFRRGRVRYLGGGRVDGGLHDQRARHGRRAGTRRRAAKDERCTGDDLDGCPWRAASLALARRLALRSPRRPAPLSLVPPKPDVYLGVSDRGTTRRIQRLRRTDRQAPGAARDLPPLGQQPQRGLRTLARNRDPADPPISTQDDQTLAEIITPEQIALGAGDDYLLQLNQFFAERNLPAYIRPLGEPNRCLNAWSAVDCDGTRKAANTRPSGTKRPSGGSRRSSAAGRRWKGSTRRWPKSACRR